MHLFYGGSPDPVLRLGPGDPFTGISGGEDVWNVVDGSGGAGFAAGVWIFADLTMPSVLQP
ncbi:hypothetical protein LMG28614_03023 [Paraburkholderia ultramafica]|uniref:Uncharacterized protein n=1 Tax=Paraburkholderia ultramafica TaxID=1544867 RepID=A0A6S7B961_9BURK|nr:hypothetical protein [Paraburkholderia ultramafica]CAB3790212.1 hypothetical protein LMG28614_03023 [Paraburkholderia ultramafica]